ncbi:MAG TPA: hypothetical protein VH063_16735 [Gaiellaceae bacterium]|jgi:hypothetical protein|nr:hypothetical protein [Gaiellaceae bacterium]
MHEERADRERSRLRGQAVVEASIQDGADSDGDSLVAGTLALQATAGNAAVAQMVRARRERTLSRLVTANPGDLQDSAGQSTTAWAQPTVQDALTRDGHVLGGPAAPGAPTALGGTAFIKPKATEATPFVGTTPTGPDLYEQSPAAASGFASVDTESDTMIEQAADSSLFIDPGPAVLDVQQMGIGDCYALATIIAIVDRDPGKITAMMVPDGTGGAMVTLYHRLPHPPGMFGFMSGPLYVPEQVMVSGELAFNRVAPGATGLQLRSPAHPDYGHQIHGAQLMVNNTPKEQHWWTVVNGSTLEVHRRDVYQMARWAPLLEKAIERFSQSYGQFGHGQEIAGEGEHGGSSGQANISGGWSGHELSLFYGQAGEVESGGAGDEASTSWAPGQSGAALLTANAAAFEGLLTLAGRGAGHATGDTTAPIVTATTGTGDPGLQMYSQRLQAAIPAAMGAPDWSTLSAGAQAKLSAVQGWTAAWIGAQPDPNPAPATPAPNTKSWAMTNWQAACATAAADAELTSPARSDQIKAALELLLVIKNSPADTGVGDRSVYANHVYSVLSVSIANAAGAPPGFDIKTFPPAIRPMVYQFVDTVASTVTLMNPHHTNAPTAGTASSVGNAADPATGLTPSESGQFTLPLGHFFMLYGSVMSNELTIPAY